jgi:hypothetical protein
MMDKADLSPNSIHFLRGFATQGPNTKHPTKGHIKHA